MKFSFDTCGAAELPLQSGDIRSSAASGCGLCEKGLPQVLRQQNLAAAQHRGHP
jgi:hypothetical protein